MRRETLNWSQEECAQAIVLREEGWTYTRIVERFGVSHTSVSRMLQRFRETGMNVRRPGQGRPRVTTAIQERYLRVFSLRQRFATVRLLQNQLEQTHGVRISTQTIINRLREYDLRPRVAAKGQALTQPIEGRVCILRESISIEKRLIGKEFFSQMSLDSASTIAIDVPLYTDVHMKDMLSAIS